MNKEIYEKFIETCEELINENIVEATNGNRRNGRLRRFKIAYKDFCNNYGKAPENRSPSNTGRTLEDRLLNRNKNSFEDTLNSYKAENGLDLIKENPELFLKCFMGRTTQLYYEFLKSKNEESLYVAELLNSDFSGDKARYNLVSFDNSKSDNCFNFGGAGWIVKENAIYLFNADNETKILSLNTINGNVLSLNEITKNEERDEKTSATRLIYTDKKTNSLNEISIFNSINSAGELPRKPAKFHKKYEEGESITIDGIWFPVEDGIQEILEALYSDKNIIENKPVKKTPKPKSTSKPKI
jgi:hypothetical protein